MVLYLEKIGILSLARNAFQKKDVTFYWLRSFTLRAFEKKFPRLSGYLYRRANLRPLEWGDTRYLENTFRDSLMNATGTVSRLMSSAGSFLSKYKDLYGIDFVLIFRKYLLAIYLFEKYLRYEFFLQYTRENPGKDYVAYVDADFFGPYEEALHNTCTVHKLAVFKNIEYFFALIGILGSYFFKWKRRVTQRCLSFDDQVLCYVTRPDEYYFDKDLFLSVRNIHFLIYDTYRDTFKGVPDDGLTVHESALSPDAYRKLRKDMFRYVEMLAKGWKYFNRIGWHAVQFYENIMFSRSYIPEGRNNTFIIFEHHDLMKTIRNEFIKARGSRIVFFPYSSGFALRYYPQEYYARYDLIFSSGKYLEDQFRESEAIDPVFVKTGSAVAHIHQKDAAYEVRLKKLIERKAGRTVVTILCPGVCKPTYYSEVNLMELARKLADTTGVEVFIRQKPFIPEPEYQDFYESFTDENDSIYLTGMEYELFDFLPVTDLFVTTYSTSACEVAMRGASVFFVDYMKHPDRVLFWKGDVSDGILLDGGVAVEKIGAWIDDSPDGPVRTAHREAMRRFIDYIDYLLPDDEFKTNVTHHIERVAAGLSGNGGQADA